MTIYQPRRESSEEINPVDTLISDFELPALWENSVCLSHPVWDNLFWRPLKNDCRGLFQSWALHRKWFTTGHLYFTSLGFLHTENVSQQSFLLKVWSFPPTFVSAFLSPSTSLSFPNSASKEEECWPLSRRDGLLREHMVRGVLGSRQRGLSVPIRFNRFQALGLVSVTEPLHSSVSLPVCWG